MSTVRGTALQGFVELVSERGGDARALLVQAHLDPDAIGDADRYIDLRSSILVLEAAATATATPDFGRRLATRQGLEILGPLGVAARTASTVGDALRDIDQYTSVYSPGLSLKVNTSPGARFATFDWSLALRRPPPRVQTAELALGAALRVYRLLIAPDFSPTLVSLKHAPLTDAADYESYFGCRVKFSEPGYGFRFPAALLRQPLSADSDVHGVVSAYLDSMVMPEDAHYAELTHGFIRQMLPTGGLDLDLVATHLSLSPRTLQRQLSAEGTSYALILDDVRREEAAAHLRRSTFSLGQIARMLGYSEQAVFTRSCHRWFGASPSQVRRAGRGTEYD